MDGVQSSCLCPWIVNARRHSPPQKPWHSSCRGLWTPSSNSPIRYRSVSFRPPWLWKCSILANAFFAIRSMSLSRRMSILSNVSSSLYCRRTRQVEARDALRFHESVAINQANIFCNTRHRAKELQARRSHEPRLGTKRARFHSA